jgi:hypothetical protein
MPWVVMMYGERSMDSEERSMGCIVVLESIKNPSIKNKKHRGLIDTPRIDFTET